MYDKERYEFYKAHGICVICGQETAKKTSAKCGKCTATSADYARIKYHSMAEEERKEKLKKDVQRIKLTREQRKAAGLCTTCGKRPPKEGRLQCETCSARYKRYNEKSRRKRGVLPKDMVFNGSRCCRCMREVPLVSGKKMCPECYKKACKGMEKARECRTEENGFERMQNGFYYMQMAY